MAVFVRTAIERLLRPKTGVETMAAALVWGNPLIAACITLMLSGTSHFARTWLVSLTIANVAMLQCFAAVFALVQLERSVARRRGRPVPERSHGSTFALSILLTPATLPLAFMAGAAVGPYLGVDASPSPRSYRIGVGFGVAAAALFFFQQARSDARALAAIAATRIRDLENARLRAELAALTAEMNPHLLFNALNTIAAMVHEDPHGAEEVVLHLAELYRGSLGMAQRSSHSLADELRLCEAYLRVEEARFGDRLSAVIERGGVDVDRWQVPVLILQPFVENAVKHGVASRVRGGRVSISAASHDSQLTLVVEDDGPGLGASTHRGAGRALANCRERLRLVYGEEATLVLGTSQTFAGTGTRVVLTLPHQEATSS